jgi:hypothetical protein
LSPTRTVSWRRGPQHLSARTNATRTGGPPACSGGNSITTLG